MNPETDENAPHKQLMTIADATAKALNEHGVPALELQGHILTNKKMMTEDFNNLACTHGVCPFSTSSEVYNVQMLGRVLFFNIILPGS